MNSTSKGYCDDNALEEEPVINVDYLSNVWREEDIWVTRRYVLREKKALKNSTRLENALWRTWTKYQRQLNIVPPDCVSWLVNSEWIKLREVLPVLTNRLLGRRIATLLGSMARGSPLSRHLEHTLRHPKYPANAHGCDQPSGQR